MRRKGGEGNGRASSALWNRTRVLRSAGRGKLATREQKAGPWRRLASAGSLSYAIFGVVGQRSTTPMALGRRPSAGRDLMARRSIAVRQ